MPLKKDTERRIGDTITHTMCFGMLKREIFFWTRDLDGNYWICRALGTAQPCYDPKLDIGAIIPVNAYKYGLEVPGQIKASFNRPRGGTCQDLSEKIIVEFSKKCLMNYPIL